MLIHRQTHISTAVPSLFVHSAFQPVFHNPFTQHSETGDYNNPNKVKKQYLEFAFHCRGLFRKKSKKVFFATPCWKLNIPYNHIDSLLDAMKTMNYLEGNDRRLSRQERLHFEREEFFQKKCGSLLESYQCGRMAIALIRRMRLVPYINSSTFGSNLKGTMLTRFPPAHFLQVISQLWKQSHCTQLSIWEERLVHFLFLYFKRSFMYFGNLP